MFISPAIINIMEAIFNINNISEKEDFSGDNISEERVNVSRQYKHYVNRSVSHSKKSNPLVKNKGSSKGGYFFDI